MVDDFFPALQPLDIVMGVCCLALAVYAFVVQRALAKCRAKGLGVLGPVVPPTQENLKQAIADGYNMIILGNDMWHFPKALKELVNDQVAPVRKELLGE